MTTYDMLQSQLSDFTEPERDHYGMHIWYEPIKQFTFPSKSYMLSPGEIERVIEGDYPEQLLGHINAMIASMPGGVVFPRLHYLSPKHRGKCTNATQVFDILRKTTRTLNVLISHRKKGCPLFLREWKDFKDATEIRCFIVGRKLTCLTQNDSMADSEPLRKPAKVKKIVVSFIDQIMHHLPYTDCTVDVVLFGNENPLVVEINTPFTMLAGTGLFSYPQEVGLLTYGTVNGPVFRYHTDAFYSVGEI